MKCFTTACLITMLSCHQIKPDNVTPFISGTYCKHVDNEYNTGNDTLLVQKLNDNVFKITRIASFRKIINGKKSKPRRRLETWTANYDKNTHTLYETKKGKVISFIPEKNSLLVGSSQYDKIKN